MSISTAVSSDRISKVVGYALKKGNFQTSGSNLPQRIAVLGQCNDALDAALDTTPVEVTTAAQAAALYGYGSPIHQIMRILRPVNGGDGVGGIPTVVYPQKKAVGATATVNTMTITLSTTATANATHYAVINGRYGVDGTDYAVAIEAGDTKAQIYVKYKNAINAVAGSPVIATNGGGAGTETSLIFTTKWNGLQSADLNVRFDDGGVDCGITYSDSTVAGAGAADISGAITAFGNTWNTIVINPYGEEVNDDLEAANGIPDPTTPTGRYAGIIFKPFIAICGSTEGTAATIGALTDARKAEVTVAFAPAPLSEGWPAEAAANMAYLFAITAQNTPHVDITGHSYPDMPVPADGYIEDFSDYTNRDYLVKKGCSTVDLVAGKYQVMDFVTTYHPDGEIPPQYRWCRNLMLDFNVRYKYYLLEQLYVVGKTITSDSQSVIVAGVIKPKDWKQQVRSLADDLALNGLSADAEFMKASITVGISGTNPDILETFFKYKRTGTARIASTDAEAGFSFGA